MKRHENIREPPRRENGFSSVENSRDRNRNRNRNGNGRERGYNAYEGGRNSSKSPYYSHKYSDTDNLYESYRSYDTYNKYDFYETSYIDSYDNYRSYDQRYRDNYRPKREAMSKETKYIEKDSAIDVFPNVSKDKTDKVDLIEKNDLFYAIQHKEPAEQERKPETHTIEKVTAGTESNKTDFVNIIPNPKPLSRNSLPKGPSLKSDSIASDLIDLNPLPSQSAKTSSFQDSDSLTLQSRNELKRDHRKREYSDESNVNFNSKRREFSASPKLVELTPLTTTSINKDATNLGNKSNNHGLRSDNTQKFTKFETEKYTVYNDKEKHTTYRDYKYPSLKNESYSPPTPIKDKQHGNENPTKKLEELTFLPNKSFTSNSNKSQIESNIKNDEPKIELSFKNPKSEKNTENAINYETTKLLSRAKLPVDILNLVTPLKLKENNIPDNEQKGEFHGTISFKNHGLSMHEISTTKNINLPKHINEERSASVDTSAQTLKVKNENKLRIYTPENDIFSSNSEQISNDNNNSTPLKNGYVQFKQESDSPTLGSKKVFQHSDENEKYIKTENKVKREEIIDQNILPREKQTSDNFYIKLQSPDSDNVNGSSKFYNQNESSNIDYEYNKDDSLEPDTDRTHKRISIREQTYTSLGMQLPDNILRCFSISKNDIGFHYGKTVPLIKAFPLSSNRKHFAPSAAKLNIFKFDHTMISTLSPNPELYTPDSIDALLHDIYGGFSWYSSVLPELESMRGEVTPGLEESLCSHYYNNKLKKVYDEALFEDPITVALIKQLHYKWSLTMLCMVKNGFLDVNSSNLLIIERTVKEKHILLKDLKVLTKLGFGFDYEIYIPSTYERCKFDKTVVPLLDEIINRRFSWCEKVNKVTVFKPMEDHLNRRYQILRSKQSFTDTSDIDLNVIYTAKRCSFMKHPSKEMKYLYEEFYKRRMPPLGEISLSKRGDSYRLTYQSVDMLVSYLHRVKMFPNSSNNSEYCFEYCNLLINVFRHPGKFEKEIDISTVFSGRVLKYGMIKNQIYAIQVSINADTNMWFYDMPIIIVARNKQVLHKEVRGLLKKIRWIDCEENIPLEFKYFPLNKLCITKFRA